MILINIFNKFSKLNTEYRRILVTTEEVFNSFYHLRVLLGGRFLQLRFELLSDVSGGKLGGAGGAFLLLADLVLVLG